TDSTHLLLGRFHTCGNRLWRSMRAWCMQKRSRPRGPRNGSSIRPDISQQGGVGAMGGFISAVVGLALTASSVAAPRVIADENGEVHSWTHSSTYVPYVPEDEAVNVQPTAQEIMEARVMAGGGHVYLVNDDPGYDLTGPNDHWFLVGDGTAFRDDS